MHVDRDVAIQYTGGRSNSGPLGWFFFGFFSSLRALTRHIAIFLGLNQAVRYAATLPIPGVDGARPLFPYTRFGFFSLGHLLAVGASRNFMP